MSEVSIRPYRDADAEPLRDAVLESVVEIGRWMSWCHAGYSAEQAVQWVSSCQAKLHENTEYNFVITNAAGTLLGGCALNLLNHVHRLANLGYWVRTSATSRGVATAAVRLLTEFAFTQTQLARLEIVCALGNVASQRVAEKAGAVREAVLKDRLWVGDRPHDAVLFAVLRSWRVA
jgi:RimJ/RimL family protein N-acetyltransferase